MKMLLFPFKLAAVFCIGVFVVGELIFRNRDELQNIIDENIGAKHIRDVETRD